ncbi:MAG: hypothetical protein QOF76_1315, partial [Solirubrobacteraceae bacterium]|nr:hypothetical protein [Solirubrobacteraceae bacterium]
MGRRLTRLGAALLLGLVLGVGPAAAADPPDPGTARSFTFGDYSYIVYVPTTYDAAKPAPLVVMTHGCQTTAEQQMKANLYNVVAEREGIVMLYPDVTDAEAAQPGPLSRCWQFPVPTQWHRDAPDPSAIAGMTHAVMDR